jgi:hypothetical protein
MTSNAKATSGYIIPTGGVEEAVRFDIYSLYDKTSETHWTQYKQA